MQEGNPVPDEVESVTIRLASLELTISVRRLDSVPSSSLGFEVVSTVPESVTSSVLPTAPEEPVLIFDFEAGIEDRVIATQTARTLEQFPLPFLAYLVVKLRSGVEGWSPKARIARAFRAGVIAGRRLNGIVLHENSLTIPLRNSYYICLRRAAGGPGFWTCNYARYHQAVVGPDGRLCDWSISQGFPSRAEVEAFLVGSRRPWPREL